VQKKPSNEDVKDRSSREGCQEVAVFLHGWVAKKVELCRGDCNGEEGQVKVDDLPPPGSLIRGSRGVHHHEGGVEPRTDRAEEPTCTQNIERGIASTPLRRHCSRVLDYLFGFIRGTGRGQMAFAVVLRVNVLGSVSASFKEVNRGIFLYERKKTQCKERVCLKLDHLDTS
jgi:hypothetical protein